LPTLPIPRTGTLESIVNITRHDDKAAMNIQSIKENSEMYAIRVVITQVVCVVRTTVAAEPAKNSP